MSNVERPSWFDAGYRHIWMPYTQMQTAPMPEAAVATDGVRIQLSHGRELIDGIASWWSACHGYNHPHIREAIAIQLDTMPHVMLAGLSNEPAFTLAARLAELTPAGLTRTFFSESGSVSVEIAMKMTVQFWLNQGKTGKNRFVAFKNGYHGDTIGTMGVGDPYNIMHGPFHGLMPKQLVVDLPRTEENLAAFALFLGERAHEVAGVIMEPLVQGAGGLIFHDAGVVRSIREICDAHEVLLILDEIMVGFGRLGTMFACEQSGIAPDIMTVSKSLTGGTIPLAATIASELVFEAFLADELERCLMHGPTFTGNALACAAANASLDLFESEPRLEQVRTIEHTLSETLAAYRDIPGVTDVRVRGAIGVVELTDLGDMYWIRQRFIEEGCWLRPFGNIIYLMPAFTIEDEELRWLTDAIGRVLNEWSDRFGRRKSA